MEVIVSENYEEMSKQAAWLVAESLVENPTGLLSFPGGDTPLGMVHIFADMVNQGEADISKARYVSLDEWVGLSDTDEGSCGRFNQEHLLGRLKKPFADVHIINGAAEDIKVECENLNHYIDSYGPLEVSVLGIGMNGHLGFNEAGVDFQLNSHIITLDETTKRVMTKYFGEKFHPTKGITQGLAQIMLAKKVILIVSGEHKADILARAMQGEISPEVPASILRNHPNCYIVADSQAAAKL